VKTGLGKKIEVTDLRSCAADHLTQTTHRRSHAKANEMFPEFLEILFSWLKNLAGTFGASLWKPRIQANRRRTRARLLL
jgi:hypothetical protein